MHSLLQAIVRLDGAALVMHVGEQPYIDTTAGRIEAGSRPLPYDVIAELFRELAPSEAHAALRTSGAAQYMCLPFSDLPAEHFTVAATNIHDDLRVVIRRHSAQRAPRFPPLVLYVEDSVDQLDLYEVVLSGRYDFLGATDGRTGVELATTRQPDLVLVDLNMPRMDGWEVCHHLKTHPRTASIPLIILTGRDGKDIEQQATLFGVAAVLHKPCTVDVLRDHISQAIGQ
jgi:CheY-like chemotaxis protein